MTKDNAIIIERPLLVEIRDRLVIFCEDWLVEALDEVLGNSGGEK